MGSFVFFTIINNWLSNEIYIFQNSLLTNMTMLIGGVALIVVTLWVMFHGYRIVTGQSQQPMMMLVGDSLRAVVIVMAATSMGAAGSQLYWTLTDGTSTAIVELVTNSNTGPFQQIDTNLAEMQIAMSTIDTIEDGGNGNIASDLTRDKWMSGIGVAGPAVIAGSLLLNKVALALFIGLGPLFILCLLFKQTAPLFQKWLLYGIGTVFSLAVLSIMVTIAMKMLAAVTAAYVAQYVASMAITGGSTSTDGLNSMALQQGGIGLILSTLLISAPPMAASFFQGTLGQVNFFSPFGRIGEGMASSRQQTALGAHPHQALPPGNTNTTANPNSKGGNTPQITGPSGFGGSGDDTVKSYNPNTGAYG
ncbi:type IV secretion system protein [Rhodanobacter sp. 7MK24]|uniref:type IV secretion system protein n=1 Tax=Rhodanobacter sp. 7MK24 TaxID=2775922 RepID=UPI0017868800|nr:type IV secretion system protein [Rhodanobacter sp. 7MK24]MBD8881534.1 type IV secretion system protein [Rhodanobacter sp. 7MK24]